MALIILIPVSYSVSRNQYLPSLLIEYIRKPYTAEKHSNTSQDHYITAIIRRKYIFHDKFFYQLSSVNAERLENN